MKGVGDGVCGNMVVDSGGGGLSGEVVFAEAIVVRSPSVVGRVISEKDDDVDAASGRVVGGFGVLSPKMNGKIH